MQVKMQVTMLAKENETIFISNAVINEQKIILVNILYEILGGGLNCVNCILYHSFNSGKGICKSNNVTCFLSRFNS